MSISEDLTKAITTVQHYEEYKFRKTWGILLIIIGIARFLLSFVFNYSIIFFSGLDYEHAIIFSRIFNIATELLLIIFLLAILLYYFVTTKKLTIREYSDFVSKRDYLFGISLGILFFLTFVYKFMHTETYFEEVIAIFLVYFILKIETEIRELLHLGIILLIISIIDIICRYILIMGFYGTGLFVDIYMGYFFVIIIIFLIPYIFFGKRIIRNSSLLMEKER